MIYPFLAVCIELQFVVVTDCNDPWVCTWFPLLELLTIFFPALCLYMCSHITFLHLQRKPKKLTQNHQPTKKPKLPNYKTEVLARCTSRALRLFKTNSTMQIIIFLTFHTELKLIDTGITLLIHLSIIFACNSTLEHEASAPLIFSQWIQKSLPTRDSIFLDMLHFSLPLWLNLLFIHFEIWKRAYL